MESYDKFSAFYDAFMGDRTNTALRLHKLIAQNKPNAKTVLELACGTGAVLTHLAKEYEVSGLDLSSRMLSIARKKLPEARFFHSDMTTFNIGKKFDVILCVFDSINHVLEFSDWKRVFGRVEAHLVKDGLFIFDINTEHKLQRHIKESASVEKFGKNLMIMDITDIGSGVSNWNVKVFEHQKGDIYRLLEENIKEKSFPIRQIKEALVESFKRVRAIDPKRQRPSAKIGALIFCMCKACS
jgi:ubiquinone/menaquinone biosynthesis C-methylase UbiE